jgi:4-hydroxy-tetrahydrodipicolinate synthase
MMADKNAAKRQPGVIVPLVTPLTEAGALDEKALRRMADHLVAGGVDAVFVIGTTGESASLPAALRSRLVAVTVEQFGGRVGVYAGISSNCLAESLAAGREYLRMGVDALVAHMPSYFPLSDQEQYDYFQALLDGLAGPLILYNMPHTTHMSIPLEVVERLADHPNVAGLKDSAGDSARLAKLLQLLGGREKFPIFVGTTTLATEGLKEGAEGFVPSIGNLIPAPCRDLYAAARAGKWDEAEKHQALLDTLGRICYGSGTLGQYLAALKALMSEVGLCGPTMLPPLQTVDRRQRQELLEGLKKKGLSLAELVGR